MHKTTHPLLRLLKHRWFDERDAARALGPQGLARIEGLVAESEHHHNGQIRVCVEAGLPTSYIRRRASAHERALALFGKLGVWDTEQNNGVLIYLLLAEHTIAIVADRGLNAHATRQDWDNAIARMRPGLRAGRFADGLAEAIAAVDATLRRAYPCTPGDGPRAANELSDRPLIL